jgi:hypothetical protein
VLTTSEDVMAILACTLGSVSNRHGSDRRRRDENYRRRFACATTDDRDVGHGYRQVDRSFWCSSRIPESVVSEP